MEVLVSFEVDEFGEGQSGTLHRLRGSARDGEEKAPIGIRDLSVVVPVHHDGTDRVVGDHEGDHGQRAETT